MLHQDLENFENIEDHNDSTEEENDLESDDDQLHEIEEEKENLNESDNSLFQISMTSSVYENEKNLSQNTLISLEDILLVNENEEIISKTNANDIKFEKLLIEEEIEKDDFSYNKDFNNSKDSSELLPPLGI